MGSPEFELKDLTVTGGYSNTHLEIYSFTSRVENEVERLRVMALSPVVVHPLFVRPVALLYTQSRDEWVGAVVEPHNTLSVVTDDSWDARVLIAGLSPERVDEYITPLRSCLRLLRQGAKQWSSVVERAGEKLDLEHVIHAFQRAIGEELIPVEGVRGIVRN